QLISFPIFGLTIGSPRMSLVVTVVVVVIAINAVNWVDGLDGLAAGVVAIGGTAFFGYTYVLTRTNSPADYSDLPTVLIADLGGVGAARLCSTLAGAALVLPGRLDPAPITARVAFPAFVPFILPLAVLILPLADVPITILRRLIAGKSPFHADRTHLHHKLLDRGHSHRRAVAIMYVWTFVVSCSAAALVLFPVREVLIGTAIGTVIAIVITVVPIPTPRLGRR